jgi:hypothetical protein
MQLWRYQGLKTLGEYLRRRDCITALATDLQVPEHLAVPTVLKQLIECLAVRLVYRLCRHLRLLVLVMSAY